MRFLTAAYLMQTYGLLLTEHELSEVLKLEPGTVRNKRASQLEILADGLRVERENPIFALFSWLAQDDVESATNQRHLLIVP